jgi:hypothetical protein
MLSAVSCNVKYNNLNDKSRHKRLYSVHMYKLNWTVNIITFNSINIYYYIDVMQYCVKFLYS